MRSKKAKGAKDIVCNDCKNYHYNCVKCKKRRKSCHLCECSFEHHPLCQTNHYNEPKILSPCRACDSNFKEIVVIPVLCESCGEAHLECGRCKLPLSTCKTCVCAPICYRCEHCFSNASEEAEDKLYIEKHGTYYGPDYYGGV